MIGINVFGWNDIPWNTNCRECHSFKHAQQRDNQDLLRAIWNHFVEVHGIEMLGDKARLN